MPQPLQNSAPIEREIESVYSLYAALARNLDPATGLGGSFLYAADPAESGPALLRAANIAGAASLAASADSTLLRRLMRESALDFVVTSLDEALRILKNELRKHEPVAVGVTVETGAIEREMLERGVQPNLLAGNLSPRQELEAFVARGTRLVEPVLIAPGSFQIFSIPADWTLSAAAFDDQLLAGLPPGDELNRRWLRLAPRYLPAAARRLRSVPR